MQTCAGRLPEGVAVLPGSAQSVRPCTGRTPTPPVPTWILASTSRCSNLLISAVSRLLPLGLRTRTDNRSILVSMDTAEWVVPKHCRYWAFHIPCPLLKVAAGRRSDAHSIQFIGCCLAQKSECIRLGALYCAVPYPGQPFTQKRQPRMRVTIPHVFCVASKCVPGNLYCCAAVLFCFKRGGKLNES